MEPLIDGDRVEYVGEIGDGDKADFVGKARALLFPIDWPEPFGLVVIEAMAVGTPVVVWRQGAMPEIVDQGETGFVVDSIEEAVEAVAAVERLDRRAVRAHFERRFAVDPDGTRLRDDLCCAGGCRSRAGRGPSLRSGARLILSPGKGRRGRLPWRNSTNGSSIRPPPWRPWKISPRGSRIANTR